MQQRRQRACDGGREPCYRARSVAAHALRAPTAQLASGPHAATRCSSSTPVSKLPGSRAKMLLLTLTPPPAAAPARF